MNSVWAQRGLLCKVLSYFDHFELMDTALVSRSWFRCSKQVAREREMDPDEDIMSALYYKFYHIIEKRYREITPDPYPLIQRYFHVNGIRFFRAVAENEYKKRFDRDLVEVIIKRYAFEEFAELRQKWYFNKDIVGFFLLFISDRVCSVCQQQKDHRVKLRCGQCLNSVCNSHPHRICNSCLPSIMFHRKLRLENEKKRRREREHIAWEWGVCTMMNPSCESYSHAGQGCDCACHGNNSDDESIAGALSSDDEMYGL